jgi:hypothetical protein
MTKRIFLTHIPFSVVHMADGRKHQFVGDKLELDAETDAADIAELDKIANRSAIYTPESGMETSPAALAEAQVAGQLAVQAALANLGQQNETAKLLNQPQQQSTLDAGSVNVAAKLLAQQPKAAA